MRAKGSRPIAAKGLAIGAAIAASMVTAQLLAEASNAGVVMISATPSGTCEISTVRGPSPIVAHLPAGDYVAICRSEVSGVTIVRSASARVEVGKGTKVVVQLGLKP